MSTPRFFVEEPVEEEIEVGIHGEDAHHIITVLRLKMSDSVVLLRDGVAWDAVITRADRNGVRAWVCGLSDERRAELPVRVAVLQAVVRGKKFDEVVDRCVQLGAVRIVPVLCERSYAKAGSEKVERWRRIAREAAQQSRRHELPRVDDPLAWKDALAMAKPLFVAWEGAPASSLAEAKTAIGSADSLTIAVGPEGSFTSAELEAAREAGARFVSLGPTILRTENAAASLLAAIASKYW